jgi:hypothetical protein
MKLINKESFDKLPANKKRILIARDVLSRINDGKFVPTREHFWSNNPYWNDKSVQDHVNTSKCLVCAKGCIFLSWVGNFNNFEWNDIKLCHYDVANSKYPLELLEVFDRETLDNIESAFEGMTFYYHYNRDYTRDYADAFKEYGDVGSDERLIAIMNHIIDNNGEFSLPDGHE